MTGKKAFLRQEMRRYLRTVPDATPDEIAELKAWVDQGNDPFSNPFLIADSSGWQLPFIHGIRAEREYIDSVRAGLVDLPEPVDESDLL